MNAPRIGALFAGYGGLEMGVQPVLGGDLAWYSEIDKGALKILTHRHPDVPNVGDVTTADWSRVEPVDILTGGSPCQDLSHAGKRAGMTDGTRSNLWVAMREAIAQLRPGLVVWENVRGAGSAEATSDLEFCPGCMGDAWYRGTVLRALGRVVGDLADLGYVGGIHGLRAADVGAPHGRFRYILAAHPAGDPWWFVNGDGGTTADTDDDRRESRIRGGLPAAFPSAAGDLLPTPAAYDGDRGGPQNPDKRKAGGHSVTLQDAIHGLRVADPAAGDTRARVDSVVDVAATEARPGRVVGHEGTLLPTPRATDGIKGGPNQRGSSGDLMLPSAVTLLPTPTSQAAKHSGGDTDRGEGTPDDANLWIIAQRGRWGDYAPAIARWENVIGRPAPAPTMTSTKGNPQLAPAFVEFMMGLPAGWVTDTPGITRNEALKALGNGVVPQQAEAALRFLLPALAVSAA